MNKKSLSPYIRTAMYSNLKAPFNINKRIIFDYEIILVGGGICKITIRDKEYLVKKNDVVFIRPGVSHKFECVDNSNFIQPHIHFDPVYNGKSEETFVSFKPREDMTLYELSLISEDIFSSVAIPDVFTPYEPEKFKKLFMEIIDLFLKKEYNYEVKYKAKMLELIELILNQFEDNKSGEYEISTDLIITVKNYIDNNYLSYLTLDYLSEHFYINKFSLIRKFKKMYNKNLMSYYREKRIEYAKKMLIDTNLSINSIGEKLNFSDVYSFSRFFKNETGVSPANYKKNY